MINKPDAQPLNYISAFANHSFDNDHSPSSHNSIILHFTPKGRLLDLLESTEIKKAISHKEHKQNNQQDATNSTIIDL